MLLERVVGRWTEESRSASVVSDPHAGNDALPKLDFLEVNWDECHRRAFRKTTQRGLDVRLLLRVGTTLHHHDLLIDSPELRLVVLVREVETLVVRPQTIAESATIAMEWGNLHVPMEVTEDAVITLPDGPAEEAAVRHQIPFTLECRRFQPRAISGISWTVAANPIASKFDRSR